MTLRLLAFVLLTQCFLSADAYKILVYNSKFAHSHSNYLGRIADILADAGHDVTSVIPIMDLTLKDGTEKSKKIHIQPDPEVKKVYEDFTNHVPNFFEMTDSDPSMPFVIGPLFGDILYRTCKRVLAEPGLLERLREEKFDVMISENFDVCGVGISEAIAPKSTIGVSTTCLFGWQFSDWGIPRALSYRSNNMVSSFNVHSFFDRLYNIYGELHGRLLFWYYRTAVDRALQEKFGPEYPSAANQSSNAAYVFTNSEPLIEIAAPTISRVIDIGGIGVQQPKKLDEYWEVVLNRRAMTVLISFGSIVKSSLMPSAMKSGIVKAISQFPEVTFIWKYEDLEDEFAKGEAAQLPNLVLTKWMPQVDILAHPNLGAFITHGGMGSTQETASRGVPGIFVPLFAEQPRNAGMMEFNGLGRVFNKFDLIDGEKLAETIRDVITIDKYRENAKRMSSMLSKKPFDSTQLLVKHVEFAAEFGASSALRPQSIDMNFIEYNNLDIALCVVLGAGIVMFLFAKIIACVAGKIGGSSKAKSE